MIRFLDAGCGQGKVSTYLVKKYGCQVTGTTIVPFEIKKAKKLALKLDLENKVAFKEMDYTAMNLANGLFDVAFTMESLVHAYDIKKTLKEIKRVLKPGGKTAFFEYSLATKKQFEKALSSYSAKDRQYYSRLTDWAIEKSGMFSLKKLRPGKLALMLKEVGFINIQEKDISLNVFPSMVKLSHLARLPYKVISLLHLKNIFVNATVAAKWFPFVTKHNLFYYKVVIAQKLV